MQCENNICIYCDNYKCILDETSIDRLGMCAECIEIDIDDEIIQFKKKKLLNKYHK